MTKSLWQRSQKILSNLEREAKLSSVIPRVVEVFEPEMIFLFGSFATGNATDSSDIDLLLILENEAQCRSAWRKYRNLWNRNSCPVQLDLLFRSMNEYRSNTISGPAEIAITEGRCLYTK